MAHGEQQIHYFSASIPNDNYVKEEDCGVTCAVLVVEHLDHLTESEKQLKAELDAFAEGYGLTVSSGRITRKKRMEKSRDTRLATKSKIRMSKVQNRIEKANPMFAEEEIKATIEADPEYYQASREIDHQIEAGQEESEASLDRFPRGEITYLVKTPPAYIKKAMEEDQSRIKAEIAQKKAQAAARLQEGIAYLQREGLSPVIKLFAKVHNDFASFHASLVASGYTKQISETAYACAFEDRSLDARLIYYFEKTPEGEVKPTRDESMMHLKLKPSSQAPFDMAVIKGLPGSGLGISCEIRKGSELIRLSISKDAQVSYIERKNVPSPRSALEIVPSGTAQKHIIPMRSGDTPEENQKSKRENHTNQYDQGELFA
jgi:hypothetical protein